MKQTNNANHFRMMVARGYLLIALLVGGIIHTWLRKWRDLETLEKENREINHFRKEVHDVYVRMIELSLLGETIWKIQRALTPYAKAKLTPEIILILPP